MGYSCPQPHANGTDPPEELPTASPSTDRCQCAGLVANRTNDSRTMSAQGLLDDTTTPLIRLVNSTSLVSQILVGLVFGILLAMFMPEWAKAAGLLGSLFVGALRPWRRCWSSCW